MASKLGSDDEEIYGPEQKADISPETWMSSLPPSLQNCPLSKLTIPGTHDSGTFLCSNKLAPDGDRDLGFLTKIPFIGSFVEEVIHRWAQCQRLDFTQQLHAGIRYFDLRVATKADSEDFFLVHSVYGPKVSDLIEAVKQFLEGHSHEFVFLDFNHFYDMKEEQHVQLITYLIDQLGPKICNSTHNGQPCDINELTLHKMWSQGKQVIIFYQNGAGEYFDEVWPDKRIDCFWPKTDDPKVCIAHLDQHFSSPPTKDFRVCQGVLTPTAATIAENLLNKKSLKNLSETLLPLLSTWIEKPPQGVYPLNIVTADFADNGDLVRKVIDLNYKPTESQNNHSN